MFNFSRGSASSALSLTTSQLFDQDKFYDAFLRDLKHARTRVIIESPFITSRRLDSLLPAIRRLRAKGVRVVVNTKPNEEHDGALYQQSVDAVAALQEIGVTVLMTVGHHRKIAIIDDDILWEGSLNILSQNDGCELMRRMQSTTLVGQMVQFIGAGEWD